MAYKIFKIKKQSGGFRTIEAPDSELKEIQKQILETLYKREDITISPFCNGFVKNRDVVRNAFVHVKKEFVVKIDIKDFFNSITIGKSVKLSRMFQILPNLQNESGFDLFVDNIKVTECYVPKGKFKDWYLPQGSPTSPYLSNILLKDMDYYIANFCFNCKVSFSRYADDITLSGNEHWAVMSCLQFVKQVIKKNELVLNLSKVKVYTKARRQKICGIVVNEKVNVDKKTRQLVRLFKHLKSKGAELTREQKGLIAWHDMVKNYDKELIDYVKLYNITKRI